MSADAYAAFQTRMGRTVRRTGDVYWYNTAARVYASFPYDRLIEPQSLDLAAVLGRDGLVARFPCALAVGRRSHRFVCDTPGFDFAHVSDRARTHTRRGLERCSVRPVTAEEVMAQGPALNRDTLLRQGRAVPAGFEEHWHRYYRNAIGTDGADIWGAFVDGHLAAYLVAFSMEGCANIDILRSGSRWLKHYPNNALLFTYVQQKLQHPGMQAVSFGFESLQPELETLERFKRHMGFQKVAVGQRIELAPRLRAVVRPPLARVLDRLIRPHVRGREFLGKVSGMLRWYGEQPRLPR
jgi:hypothetical protein